MTILRAPLDTSHWLDMVTKVAAFLTDEEVAR